MKKLISIVIMTAMLLSVFAVYVYADDGDNPGVEIMNSYLEEDINHYFLPVAYDLTRIYNRADSTIEYTVNECINEVYTELTNNDSDKIDVPPIKAVFENDNIKYCPLSGMSVKDWFKFYIIELDEEYEKALTSAMRRSIAVSMSGNKSIKTAQRAFLAPWVLYDDGELYTWVDLMSMSTSELENLNYKTPDFEKFITNVKNELESRGWWKEEYQEKYNILYAHKDDYRNSLDDLENFVIDGNSYNFATMYYEYTIEQNNVNDIISVNIYEKGFMDIIERADQSVIVKYKDMFDDIKTKLEKDSFNVIVEAAWITWDWYEYLYILNDFEIGMSHYELSSTNYMCNIIMYRDNYDMDLVRDGVERYCYETNTSLPQWRIDQFVGGDLRASMLAFSYDNALILDAEKDIAVDMSYLMNSKEVSYFLGKEDDIVDIEGIIVDIKQYMTHLDRTQKKYCQDDIAYLESLLDASQPQTGENTVLYIAIATAALAAMTALVVRRKRKIVLQ